MFSKWHCNICSSLVGAPLLLFTLGPRSKLIEAAGPVNVPVGSKPTKLNLKDIFGRSPKPGEKVLPAVYVFLSTSCPVSDSYTSRMLRIERTFRRLGIPLIGVFSNALDSTAAVKRYAENRDYSFTIIKDDGALAKALGATVTPQAVVLDKTGIIRYRGRIDDSPEIDRVTSHDLENVLTAISSDRAVSPKETRAFGCVIT